MKNVSKLLVIGVMLMLVSMLIAPVAAQDEGAGEGGTIVLANTADDPSTFNPLLGGDTTSSDVYGRLYPTLFGVSPFTGAYEKSYPGTMASDWEFNEDGTVLTVTLRDDVFWPDGEQITSEDWLWGAEALRTGLLDSPRSQMWEVLDDGTPAGGPVVDVTAPDDFTLVFEFARPDCQNQNLIDWSYFIPSHIYEEQWGDDLAAMNDDPRYLPGVYYNVWSDPELVPGDRVSLLANEAYTENELGYVSPGEWVYLNLPDSDIALERFRAGDLTWMGIPGNDQAEFRELAAAGEYDINEYNRLGYVFYAFNLADPENPQPGVDEEGNMVEQDPHPVLSDKLVRQAIATAIDMDALIESTLGGAAVRVGIPSIPISWDWNPDLLYPFDPAAASSLLDEAGWVLEDGADYRTCQGCFYSTIDPEFEGTEMTVTLNATPGSEDADRMIEAIAEYMRDVGINAQPNFIEWGSAFLPALTGQTFDMAILAWSMGLPLDPDNTQIFGSAADVPGSGFNFPSYHSETFNQLMLDARDPALTDGCSVEGRLEYYQQAHELLFDELPYLFMYSNLRMAAVQPNVEGWDPAPFSRSWNEDVWTITEMEPAS